jgi:hypothetical protein
VTVDPAAVPVGGVQAGTITVNSNVGSATVDVRFVRSGYDQPGTIGVYSDIEGTSTQFVDNGGPVQVHMIHVNHGGAAAAQFKLEAVTGWAHVGDIWSFSTVLGVSITGVSVAYGGCQPSPTYLGVATFIGSEAPWCSTIRIIPDPNAASGSINVVGCASNLLIGQGGSGIVNYNSYCGGGIPVRRTTWGKIKAMYSSD